MKRNVAIVHYNTPELTEAAILSVKKHGGEEYCYYIFDNSDKRPFKKKMKGVKVFDNTKGKYVDFEKELAKFPDKEAFMGCAKGCEYGSDKHMMSVQKLWDLVPDGFLLMDSDILVKQSVEHMFMEDECVCGHIAMGSGLRPHERLAPMLLWINVPLCKAGGARFFDPNRTWALYRGLENPKNCWDTGAALLEDIRTKKPQCHGWRIDIRPLMVHYGAGSWMHNEIDGHKQWLEEHRDLWWTDPNGEKPKRYTVLTYIFGGYEPVHEIEEKDPEADYVLVTDDPKLKSKTWRVVCAESLKKLPVFDRCYQVRFHPFSYVHTKVVLRIDACVKVKRSLAPMVDTFLEGDYDRCVMIHPKRDNVRDEYAAWVEERSYPQAQADKCMALMEKMGYDLDTKGLYQCGYEIQRANAVNGELNGLVYELLKYLGEDGIERVDQTVTSFVMNHLFSDRLKVLPVSELVFNGNLLELCVHGGTAVVPLTRKRVTPYLFGEPCDTKNPVIRVNPKEVIK